MAETQVIGDWGEKLACNYLKKQKIKILETNFYCRLGEIDIIARDKDTLVFIEVRVRKTVQYGDALESITEAKQRKVRKTAQLYMLQKKYEGLCRIDAIGIDSSKNPVEISWIQNAF